MPTYKGIEFRRDTTPWGYAQQYENLNQGIFTVSTASHGGIFIPFCMLHCIPLDQQEWAEKWSGSKQWYEEDCCVASVIVAFPNLFSSSALESAKKIIAEYFPAFDFGPLEYWQATQEVKA